MIALCTAGLVFILRGWLVPLLALAIVGFTVVRAHVGRAFVPFVLATIPLILSILLINTFLFPGATDTIFTIGPFRATATGLTAAGQASLRVVAFALSVAVFALTTPTDDLLVDLERRGARPPGDVHRRRGDPDHPAPGRPGQRGRRFAAGPRTGHRRDRPGDEFAASFRWPGR